MAVEVFMPKAGMDMKEGKIINWLKNAGDKVQEGDGLLEIETDKVTMEVESPATGTLLCKYFEDGATVPVVTVIGYIGAEGEDVPKQPTLAGAEVSKGATLMGAEVPKEPTPMGAEVKAAVVNEGYVPATAYAKALAKENGILLQTVVPTGQTGEVKARDVLEKMEELKKESSVYASPLAKRIADDNGMDLHGLQGSGYNGKIMKADVSISAPAAQTVVEPAKQIKNAPVKDGFRRAKIAGMRKVVAERMLKSHTEMPCVTHNMKADVTELLALRETINAKREKADKISINDFVIKAVAKALVRNKNILVSLEGDEIVYKEGVINIGMAVGMDTGLIVPVLKGVDKMGLEAVSATAKDLAKRARAGKLTMEEYKGSTFTISNLGMYEVESFSPIINQPDSGILGVCAVTEELAMVEGEVVVRKKLGLSFTHDHRVIDGVPAAEFLRTVKHLLEDPMSVII